MTATKPKAYSYLRFSSSEQMKGDSFRRQTTLAQAYAAREQLDLDEHLTFNDLGVSAFRGKNLEAGRLGDFLQAVREGIVPQGSYLLVESLDRISRQAARRALRALEEIVETGVNVVTLADERKYDLETLEADPFSLMYALMIFIRSNEESAMKSRRLKASWDNKRSHALVTKLTSRCPSWLRLENNEFVVLEERAAVVRRAFEMAKAGVGLHKIAQTFNDENIPRFGNAAHWHKSFVMKLLDSQAPIGIFVPHETVEAGQGKRVKKALEPVPAYFPAVVDKDVYDAVRLMRTSVRAPTARGSSTITNVLASLAKCPRCGGAMTRVSKGSQKRAGKPYLVCQRAKVGAGCEYRSAPYQQIEDAIFSRADLFIADAPSGLNDVDAAIDETREAIGAYDDEIENLVGAIGASPSVSLSKRLREAEDAKEGLVKHLADLREKLTVVASWVVARTKSDLLNLAQAEKVDRTAVNCLLRVLLSKVVVEYEQGILELHWKNGAATDFVYDVGLFFNVGQDQVA